LRGSQHGFHPGCQPRKDEQHQKDRHGSKQVVQPVSDAKADRETGHQLNHHPPCQLGLRILISLGAARWIHRLLRLGDPLFQRLKSCAVSL
jgi:hypothetical protein